MGSTVDGEKYIRNLASYIRSHEKRFARAPYRAPNHSIFSDRPVQLQLTVHHLYYLLTKFEELGVNTGPLNIRIENLHSETFPSDYTSFLNQSPKKNDFDDNMSLNSIVTMGSILSNVSSVWSIFSTAPSEASETRNKQRILAILRYIYSCFTKLPAISLVYNPKTPLISQYEEFPLDTAVPITVFKNLSSLEIRGYDIRSIFGWDFLSTTLKSLILHHCDLADLSEVLIKLVLDDAELYRFRSSRQTYPQQPNSQPCEQHPAHANLRRSVSLGSKDYLKSSHPPVHKTLSQSVLVLSKDGNASSSGGTENQSANSSSSLMEKDAILSSSSWSQLLYLRCSSCKLKSIPKNVFLSLQSLVSLDLSGNELTEIPYALGELPQLCSLNLASNKITGCRTFYHISLSHLQILVLSRNHLTSLSGLENVPSLEKLDIRDNSITDVVEFRRLVGNTNFEEAYLSLNPFTKTYSSYRITIFNYFREYPGSKDIMLDGRGPGMLEKMYLSEKASAPERVISLNPVNQKSHSPAIKSSSTLRKASKTRIVDLSAPNSAVFSKNASGGDTSSNVSLLNGSASEEIPQNTESGQVFRKKIEMLRQEAGPEWVDALMKESVVKHKFRNKDESV
ncbi:Leucine Rich Repeat domain protein [Schizosaccharomyces pombe]|uniref:Uncharacterized leucine-rich repeat-containing protein C926.06c n=1 Tax=Schizosaccharomyces pombe (strain 972 / ATCC 24843) TaxID=284812 RepID=YFT6_SCHPO|nr:leucine-rich repeat-containing protein [Schizosaccharomyces pombe]Q9UUG2.1 RecName: Full=Uncharacterized leucine-rich repeat-containing protein C926.06c [Schizosaccharomyces pombe 972h-]CAB54154.1 leucine-rich repeat protein, unknown [Schizosaccharomyces pombe]|eukprot:NP_594367.1 leucine-rich repeat-containing protein [Schizosaccharomyces pombe]